MPKVARHETTLPPLAWAFLIAAGLLLVLLVAGIGVQIAILKDSRDHIRAQDVKTAVLLDKVRSLDPAARRLAPVVKQVGPLVRRVNGAIDPLTNAGHRLVTATEDLPSLVRAGLKLTDVSLPALTDLREAAPQLLDFQRRLLELQLETLDTQRRSLRTQLDTLATQREALRHIESIDRKTGGAVPPTGTGTPVP